MSPAREPKELNGFLGSSRRLIDVWGSRIVTRTNRRAVSVPHVGRERRWLATVSDVDCSWVKPHVEISFNHCTVSCALIFQSKSFKTNNVKNVKHTIKMLIIVKKKKYYKMYFWCTIKMLIHQKAYFYYNKYTHRRFCSFIYCMLDYLSHTQTNAALNRLTHVFYGSLFPPQPKKNVTWEFNSSLVTTSQPPSPFTRGWGACVSLEENNSHVPLKNSWGPERKERMKREWGCARSGTADKRSCGCVERGGVLGAW